MVSHHHHPQKQNTFSQSLNTGRPPSFSLAYIDCRFPQYDHSNKDNKGTACTFLPIHSLLHPSPPRTSVEIWQFRFAAECVADVTSRTLTAHAPSYTTIMELDRKISQFPLPEGLSNPPNNDLSATFMRCVLDHIKDTGTHPPFLALAHPFISLFQFSCTSTEVSLHKLSWITPSIPSRAPMLILSSPHIAPLPPSSNPSKNSSPCFQIPVPGSGQCGLLPLQPL